MAAYDNVQLPGPPNGAQYLSAGANLAQAFGSLVSGLGDSYQSGKNFQFTQQQRDLFKSPENRALLQNAMQTGQYAPLLQKLIETGGAQTAAGLAPQLMGQKADEDVANAIGGGQQPANSGPGTSTPHAGPANITGDFGPRQSGTQQPSLSATGGSDAGGGETVRTLAAGIGGGNRDMPQSVMTNLAASLGVGPDDPISAGQLNAAKNRIGNWFQRSGSSQSPAPTQPLSPGGPTGAAGGPVSSGYEQDEGSTNQGTPVGTGGAPQITPAPSTGGGGLQGGRVAQAAPQATPQATPAATRATPLGTAAQAQALIEDGKKILARGMQAARFSPAAKDLAEKAAQQRFDQAKQIMESIGAYNKPTPEMMNVAPGPGGEPSAALQLAQIKGDEERYGKQLVSIQASAQAADRQLQHIQLAEGIYKNPNFYSGPLESVNVMYKRVLTGLRIDPGASLPQEAFRKTMAASVLNQVEQLKDDTAAAGGGGRIFQAQIALMEKAANNPDNTIPANRLLTEINKRASLESKHIAQMANSYKGGHLDAGFAQKLDDYYTQYPMFTPEEMQDIRRIAPPVAPKLNSEAEARDWAAKARLKAGEPMKLPSGRIVPAPDPLRITVGR